MSMSDKHSKTTMTQEERQTLAKNLDADLDRFMDDLAANKESRIAPEKPFNFEQWCAEIDQHPAFLKGEPTPGPDGQYSAAIEAIRALKYDEDDPIECAQAHKEEGNRHFAAGKFRWAAEAYTKGIRLFCADPKLNSILYANRAAAHRHLGNLRSAIRDCLFARRLQPDNAKAILRGAECLLDLGQAGKCLMWIEESSQCLVLEEEQKRKLDELWKNAEQQKVLEERDRRKNRAKSSVDSRRAQQLLEALKKRKIKFQPPIVDLDDLPLLQVKITQLDKFVSVHMDPANHDQLVWPLLLQYPESGQTDFLTDSPEYSPFDSILAEVFDSPAEWDPDHKFRSGNVRMFIPLDRPDGSEVIREIVNPKRQTLAKILEWENVVIVNGLPVIQIYTLMHIQPRLRLIDQEKHVFQLP